MLESSAPPGSSSPVSSPSPITSSPVSLPAPRPSSLDSPRPAAVSPISTASSASLPLEEPSLEQPSLEEPLPEELALALLELGLPAALYSSSEEPPEEEPDLALRLDPLAPDLEVPRLAPPSLPAAPPSLPAAPPSLPAAPPLLSPVLDFRLAAGILAGGPACCSSDSEEPSAPLDLMSAPSEELLSSSSLAITGGASSSSLALTGGASSSPSEEDI